MNDHWTLASSKHRVSTIVSALEHADKKQPSAVATLHQFLGFAFAVFRKAEEDQDTGVNRAARWIAWGSTLLAPFFKTVERYMVPLPGGRLVSVDTLATEWAPTFFLAVLLLSMFWGAFEKYRFEKAKRDSVAEELAERVRKKLLFVYAWEDCLKHGVYSESPGQEGLLVKAHTILRVGIRSDSLTTIRDVTVKQARGRGNLNPGVQVGQQFRRTHGDYSSFTVHNSSEPIVLIDVCQHDYWANELSKITFLYSNPVQFTVSKESPFHIECALILQGEDTASITKSFLITIDHSNSWWPVTMKPIEE